MVFQNGSNRENPVGELENVAPEKSIGKLPGRFLVPPSVREFEERRVGKELPKISCGGLASRNRFTILSFNCMFKKFIVLVRELR